MKRIAIILTLTALAAAFAVASHTAKHTEKTGLHCWTNCYPSGCITTCY